MRLGMINLFACVILFGAPAGAGDWTTSYASLARTSYLAGAAASPPFAILWEYESPQALEGAPLVAIGRTYLSDAEFHVWCLDLGKGEIAWKHDEARDLSEVKCYNALDGALKWTQKVDGKMIHTPQLGQRNVYVATDAGTLYAFSQADGKLVWSVALASPLTIAAADENLVAIGSGPVLTGLSVKDGSVQFATDLGGKIEQVPVVTAAGVYAIVPGSVVAVDRAGVERWRAALPKNATTRLAVTKAGVLVGCADGTVHLLALDTGVLVWETILAGVPGTVSGAGEVVFAGTRQSTLVGMRLADGAKLWSADLKKGAVDGVALSAGKLLVVAGKWVGALIPAPEAPGNLKVAAGDGNAVLTWEAPEANGSKISGYLVYRRRGTNETVVGTVPAAGQLVFSQDELPGNIAYSVVAVAENGAASVKSAEVTLAKGEPLLRKLAVSPVPFDPRSGVLNVSFELRQSARVTWDVVDAEGTSMIEERTAFLGKGPALMAWEGEDRSGEDVEPGVYRVRVKATAFDESEEVAKAFPVNWVYETPGEGLPGGVPGQPAAPASTGGPVSPAPPPNPGGSPAADDGKDKGGVRDHGKGEGRDGHGQGKGSGK